MSYVYPKHELISLKNHRIPAFLRFMKSDKKLVEVKKSESPLPIGNCYWNVDAMIRRYGGTPVYGWDIAIWSKSHISAMHHAVWKRSDGVLLDVTDTYPTVKNRISSTFLPDDRIEIDLQRQPNIPAKHFVFSHDDATLEFVQACQELHLIDQRCAALAYEAGYRCQQQFGNAEGVEQGPGFALSLTPAAAAQYSSLANQRPSSLQRIGDAITALMKAT